MTSRALSIVTVTVSAVLMLGLAGCSSPIEPPAPEPVASEPGSATPAAGGALPEFESVCTDATSDTEQPNGADFTEVSLLSDGSLLFVTFTLANGVSQADLPDSNFQILVYDPSGNGGYILGITFTGGDLSSVYAFDNEQAKQKNYDNGYVFDGGQVSIRFPVADLVGLEDGLSWYATSSVDTANSDYCGNPIDGMNVVEFGG